MSAALASRDARPRPARAVAGVVEFTAHGDAALDELARTLTAPYDGTTDSITQMLAQVLNADIADLVEVMTDAAHAARIIGDRPPSPGEHFPGLDVSVVEGQTAAARRRLAQNTRAPLAGSATSSRGIER